MFRSRRTSPVTAGDLGWSAPPSGGGLQFLVWRSTIRIVRPDPAIPKDWTKFRFPGISMRYGKPDDLADGHAGEAPMNNKLKVLRAMRNWSQAELADRLDVSRQAVNAIETGKYDPSLPLAFKLARLFEMPIEDIFDDGHEG
ncbi:DNA-binding XRE family transcriptional regulator [Sphingopyxis sp. JAI108]|nr:DNA-binding XRE family transcriptional regulator [Sphingopyxis sp. JAI108]